MYFPEEIETARMWLRPFGPQDTAAHVEILGNWDVTQWLSTNIPFPYTQEDGVKFIADAMAQFQDGSSIRYAMTNKASRRHMGGIRIFTVTEETEVGYWMHPDYWGKGLGTELLNAALGAGFETGIIKSYVAQTAAANKGSRRILEKVGFIHEGAVPEVYDRDGHCEGCSEFYRLRREDWKKP